MITVMYDADLAGPNTWHYNKLSSRTQIVTRCANGHIGSLDNHEIAPDGTVSPSVVCQKPGCNYHEFIRLDGYKPPEEG